MAKLFPPPPPVAAGDSYELWRYDGEKWGPRSLSWPGNRNILHNGQGLVSQYGIPGSGITVGSSWGFVVDRWVTFTSAAGNRLTANQVWLTGVDAAPVPPAQTALTFTSAASAYTPAASDQFALWQGVEYANMAPLMLGTARAFPMTLSFWAYANIAGVYSGAVQGTGSPTRVYIFTYTLPTTTWTYVTITIQGDTTSGTWLAPNWNAAGLWLVFDLGGGANKRATPAGWVTANPEIVGATNSVQLTAGPSRFLYITNLQLEVGSVATPYDQRPYAAELAICQRYYEVLDGYYPMGPTSATGYITWPFKVTKRAAPTVNLIYDTTGVMIHRIYTDNVSTYKNLGNFSICPGSTASADF